MAEDRNDLMLRLLREIRATQEDDALRLRRVERRVDELHESAGVALGFAAHATQTVEGHGQQFDALRDDIEAPKRRVAELEAGR